MHRSVLLLPAVIIVGCASKSTTQPTTEEKKTASVTSLNGPGGRIDLGASLSDAKSAFPAPKGAQIFDTSMSFAILKTDGWSWASENPGSGFEAALRNGKAVAFGRIGAESAGEPQGTISDIGEPTRKFEGKTASAYVWESGPNARFLILVKKPLPMMPFGSMTLIGNKEDLKLLNYRADDPATFVRQMDAAQDQMNSPEMKKIFEQAKERAKAKRAK